MKKNYQRKERKSNHKFEVVRGQELLVRVPLPMAEVWAEMQAAWNQARSLRIHTKRRHAVTGLRHGTNRATYKTRLRLAHWTRSQTRNTPCARLTQSSC